MKISRKAAEVNSSTKYDKATEYIQSAIQCLGDISLSDRSDILAKESIANLSVVLLDLKSE